jgi:translation initiation factor 3 subunit H
MFKPVTPPSRLDSLLITKQIANYCDQINNFAGESFSKLFMVAGLRGEQK